MKKIAAFIVFTVLSLQLPAQPTGQQHIEDSVIGWKKVYSFKANNTSSPYGNQML